MNPKGKSPLGGIICIWSGAIVDIPDGWVLCDGNNGTPDLRDKFVLGAGLTYAPNDTGGVVWHTHTFTGDGHNHQFVSGPYIPTNYPEGQVGIYTTIDNAHGTTDTQYAIPPFVALAYIMKT